jgi:hypothetical protein
MTSSQDIAKDIARSFHTSPVFSMQQCNADPTNQASVNEGFQPVQIYLSPRIGKGRILKRDLQYNIVNIYHPNP